MQRIKSLSKSTNFWRIFVNVLGWNSILVSDVFTNFDDFCFIFCFLFILFYLLFARFLVLIFRKCFDINLKFWKDWSNNLECFFSLLPLPSITIGDDISNQSYFIFNVAISKSNIDNITEACNLLESISDLREWKNFAISQFDITNVTVAAIGMNVFLVYLFFIFFVYIW